MKAISLWQPWATAIALGAKTVETRSWYTPYRGPLAIHAAKRCIRQELIHLSCMSNWTGALADLLQGDSIFTLPFGAIVATCELAECRPTGDFTNAELDEARFPKASAVYRTYFWTERGMGDFSLGRYGWVLKNIEALPEPIPWRGEQGFFNVQIPGR